MKIFTSCALAVSLVFSALSVPALHAGEGKVFLSPTLPDGSMAISALTETSSDNNVCKWLPDHTPGARRDLCQRVVNGRKPVTLSRYALKIASVGQRAPGAAFTFRLMKFEDNRQIAPLPTPVISVDVTLPDVLEPGEYLVFDFPEVELEPSTVYGLEVGFKEAGEGHSINFATTARSSYSPGRIYFFTNDPDVNQAQYVLRSNNLIFFLGSR